MLGQCGVSNKIDADTIFLHIGHGKTGSTYLQSAFALSESVLHSSGICYPMSEAHRETGSESRIASGNADMLLSPDSVLAQGNYYCRSFLFSNEGIFDDIRTYYSKVQEYFQYRRIKCLFFVRDPAEMIPSHWQQRVKRAGETRPLGEWMGNDDLPCRVSNALRELAACSDVETTIVNYSRHRDRLVGVTEGWLGVENGLLITPGYSIVNRSLTAAELQFQLEVNRQCTSEGAWFSDALCQELPSVATERIRVPRSAFFQYLDRHAEDFSWIQARLPDGEAYNLDAADTLLCDDDESFSDIGVGSLSGRQVSCMVGAFFSGQCRLAERKFVMDDRDSNWLDAELNGCMWEGPDLSWAKRALKAFLQIPLKCYMSCWRLIRRRI